MEGAIITCQRPSCARERHQLRGQVRGCEPPGSVRPRDKRTACHLWASNEDPSFRWKTGRGGRWCRQHQIMDCTVREGAGIAIGTGETGCRGTEEMSRRCAGAVPTAQRGLRHNTGGRALGRHWAQLPAPRELSLLGAIPSSLSSNPPHDSLPLSPNANSSESLPHTFHHQRPSISKNHRPPEPSRRKSVGRERVS